MTAIMVESSCFHKVGAKKIFPASKCPSVQIRAPHFICFLRLSLRVAQWKKTEDIHHISETVTSMLLLL